MAGDASGMISNWAGGGATTTLGAIQFGLGYLNDKKNKRPEYNIPPEIAANLSDAELAAMEGLPEAQKRQYLSNLQRGTAFGLRNMGSRKAGLVGLATLNEQQNQGNAQLLSMDAAARMANRDRLYAARQNMADYKDKSFQLNKQNPYYENKARDQAMMGAGMQNISQGLQSTNSGYDWGSANPSGNQYYTPNGKGGMVNYNPYSNNGSEVMDGQFDFTQIG